MLFHHQPIFMSGAELYCSPLGINRGLALAQHAGQMRVGGLHILLRTLWGTPLHAGFLTMFSFTAKEVIFKRA